MSEVKLPPGVGDVLAEIDRLSALADPTPEESSQLTKLILDLTKRITENLPA